uniref:Uncharacterized protein n=1 Tax=Panagrolaimus sp. PS1159 TaxID=55785 RepID=A0AC35G027_9BILA
MASNSIIICFLVLLLTVNTSARAVNYAQSEYGDSVQLKSGGSNDDQVTTSTNQNGGSNIYPQLNNNDGGNSNYPQNNQDSYPQGQQDYVQPTRESKIKHIIKSAIKGAIMGAAASAAAAAMQTTSNDGNK